MPLPDFMRDYVTDKGGILITAPHNPINQFTATEFRDLLVAFKELQDKVKVLESNSRCKWCGLTKCQCGEAVGWRGDNG